MANLGFIIETGEESFSDENSATITFERAHQNLPSIVATPYDSAGNQQASISINYRNITTTSFIMELSAPLTGQVHWKAQSSFK